MTPQESQLIQELFDRLAKLENSPRDAEAARAIADGLRRAPNAPYALAQTVLVQDEALKRADARIRELEAQFGIEPGQPAQPAGFLDNMRDALFGKQDNKGSVPSVRAPAGGVAPPSGVTGGISPTRAAPTRSGGVWGHPAPPQPGGWSGGAAPMQAQAQPAGAGTPMGGSFLGTAAAAAAGAIGGALLMNSFRGMFGNQQQPHSPQAMFDRPGGNTPGSAPWAPVDKNSDIARDAGLQDIGRDIGSTPQRTTAYDKPQRSSLFDDAPNDTNDQFDVADSGDFDLSGDGGET